MLQLNTIADVQAHARQWLFDSAAPLWSTAGILPDGMFAERLKLDGTPAAEMNRRMRVQARQIYAYSVIGQLGWDGPWRSAVENALSILLERGLSEDGHFVHLFDAQGQVINRAKDLYDHAFGLFALAHASRALGRPDLLDRSFDILQIMMKTWWRPEGGFWEGELTPCPPYRQNPHMHMFEAAVINYELSGKAEWRDLADRLHELFVGRFQDPATGAVTEYFDKEWQRLPAGEGDIVEPGHCLEWAWLFEVGVPDGQGVPVAERLVDFARAHGIDHKAGVAINEVYLDGRIKDGGARLWPQTERLKAAVARYQRLGAAEASEVVDAYKGLWLYLDMPVLGTWRDRLNADGGWVAEDAPASSFYHIVCGLDQLLNAQA